MNQHRGAYSRVGVIRQIVGCAELRQSAVAEELVDVPAGIDNGGHDDLKQRVEARHRVLGRTRLGEWRELATLPTLPSIPGHAGLDPG